MTSDEYDQGDELEKAQAHADDILRRRLLPETRAGIDAACEKAWRPGRDLIVEGYEQRLKVLLETNESLLRSCYELEQRVAGFQRLREELVSKHYQELEVLRRKLSKAEDDVAWFSRHFGDRADGVPMQEEAPRDDYRPGDYVPARPGDYVPAEASIGGMVLGRRPRPMRFVPAHDITAYELARVFSEVFQPTVLEELLEELEFEVKRHFRPED